MLWLRSCRFNLRTHTSSFHIFQWVSSSKQSTDTHVSQPNQVQLLSLLRRLQTRSQLMQIHCQLITSGIHHDQMDKTMMLIWNTLLREYSQGSFPEEALQLYKQMQDLSCTFVPTDSITFSFLIKACANLVDPIKGIIDGYTRINRPTEALTLFSQMMAEGIKPTSITILSLLPAVSNLGALDIGESIHAYVEKSHCNTSDIRVSNSLIDMYGKCGSLQNAFGVFDVIAERRNVVSWTSMISALASHGMAREAINQFEEMKAADIKPNQVTFLSVLNACSHGGLVDVGMKFFTSMIEEYGILPGIKHYGCMIDMLGRAGMLDEAEKMVMDMPMKDNVIVWRTLLGACSFHGNVEMGERVMERILEMEKGYGGDYVLLSNIFARDGRFDEAERVRRSMDEKNVLKVPGISLVDGKSRI
ncbi:pentatricopeptide repeat-containing protein At1g09220, mitochondrial-like isoform X3 [Magnolia sinica]|uniref:pentatricopeptide repeat-containing protein At1g09220, mitochondrial-like isoform X3 n=1 Tax=Magnolia sinica TaxID=86752 RepID=UPI00265959B4|nr:pentatricopeptide repeat-containing protein At1g09220, mitochondrial-like isoform X3 [Magnolia sinica]